MNQLNDSNNAYQQSFLTITVTFIGLSIIALFMEAQTASILTHVLTELAKSIFHFFQGRSARFYVLIGGLLLFSFPSCLIILLAIQKGPKQLKYSVDEEASYWQSSTPDSTAIYPNPIQPE